MILFVCTGNTCRSPLAAALARSVGIDAESAGLSARTGDPATPQAVWAAEDFGADLTRHRAKRVTAELLKQADRVYAMTEGHLLALQAAFPAYAGKMRALEPAVPDPYGGDEAVYAQCVKSLRLAMRRAGILN